MAQGPSDSQVDLSLDSEEKTFPCPGVFSRAIRRRGIQLPVTTPKYRRLSAPSKARQLNVNDSWWCQWCLVPACRVPHPKFLLAQPHICACLVTPCRLPTAARQSTLALCAGVLSVPAMPCSARKGPLSLSSKADRIQSKELCFGCTCILQLPAALQPIAASHHTPSRPPPHLNCHSNIPPRTPSNCHPNILMAILPA